MYAYTHDAQTGGLFLNDSTPLFSKEPRPVYYRELDILGFNAHWKYEQQDELPYMWAEANCYWYRGRLVVKTRGGSLYTAPALEFVLDADGERVLPDGETLSPVDITAMIEKNRELLEVIEQVTVKKIFDVYKRYRKKLDCFHVAFSGGKDSMVLLELVKKALPKSGFVVVFSDTGMEFPDTYDVIDKIEEQCRADEIEFYRAASRFKPEESWRLFGPPSRVLRWCCSVHKSAPQTLKLREVLGKSEYTGMVFVGVRSHESVKRDEQLTQKEIKYQNPDELAYIDSYDKIKGQRATKSIYEWTSAEVWLYIFAKGLFINEAYKKGSARVGCLCCPMGSSKADYFQYVNYADEVDKFTRLISLSNGRENISAEEYVSNGGWNARKNGRFLKDNRRCYSEITANGLITIEVNEPKTGWCEWIKTLGDLTSNGNRYTLDYDGKSTSFEVKKTNKCGYIVTLPEQVARDSPEFGKLFRYVFRKAAYCVKCATCQANCRQGCISFSKDVKVEGCIHCHECHDLIAGCLAYDSLKIPNGEGEKMEKAINCFSNHAPKTDWFIGFFGKKNDYLSNNTLGPVQRTKFKRFLKDAGLLESDHFSDFAERLSSIGWDSEVGLGLLLVNIAYNPQVEWYIKNLDIGHVYPRKSIEDMLTAIGQSKDNIDSIIPSFKRLCELPFGTKLNFGTVTEKRRQIETLARNKSTLKDNRVVLYSLYKFAEACEGYYQFTLTRLLDHTVESAGISPTRIFGFDRDEMERFLNGLSAKYPDFINAAFTHDLDKITLREDKTSIDVLTLF
ncbi:MAG: phosphoadenosine phosphosulfate reductase family protein [Synergistaceae bacterium]|jgi:phosphoadenosine phosphosulfate reductase|nr:phosphoadenosine phosphosulfate reductase family protein [Synergistaceae bacterium]